MTEFVLDTSFDLFGETNPDWLPSLNMGHGKSKIPAAALVLDG